MVVTDSGILNFVIILGILYTILYFWMKYKHSYWKKRGIRSPPCHWLFGHLKDAILLRTTLAFNLENVHKQGSQEDDVLGIYIFHKPFLLLRSPTLIKQVLVKDFNYFSDRHFGTSLDDVSKWNLFTVNNPEWKYLRTKISPVFSTAKIKRQFELMLECANTMKNYFENELADDSDRKLVLVKIVARKYGTDVISSLAFGIRTNSFEQPPPEFYKYSIENFKISIIVALKAMSVFFFPKLSRFLMTTNGLFGRKTDYFRNVFWDSMNHREEVQGKRGDVIDNLVELKNEKQTNSIFKFEGDALFAQSTIFFVAGRETAVTTMTYVLYELAKWPEIQKKTRDSIRKAIKEHGMTYEAVQNMKYLSQVISETLRLHSSIPMIDRVANMDYKIPGTNVVIEKGTPVYISTFGMQKDPRFFKDPEKFDPERFNEENKSNIVPGTYLPFGDGPRNCIGMRMGLLQTTVGIMTILMDYEIELNPMCSYTPELNPFISPPDTATMYFKKISMS